MLINRIVEQLIFPPGIFILLGIAILWLTRNHRRFGNLLLLLLFLSLWLVSTPWFSHSLLATLQDQYLELPKIPQDADSIVLLGGGTTISGNAYQLSSASFERLHTAARLAKKSGLPILTSGGKPWGTNKSEAALLAATLERDFGLATKVIEEKSKTTWEHPINLKPLLQEQGLKKPIVVTHAWHIPRAMFSFQHHQVEALPGPAHRIEPLMLEKGIYQYFPGARSLEQTRIALHEWLGLLVYQFKASR